MDGSQPRATAGPLLPPHRSAKLVLHFAFRLGAQTALRTRQPTENEGVGMLMTVVFVLHIIASELTTP